MRNKTIGTIGILMCLLMLLLTACGEKQTGTAQTDPGAAQPAEQQSAQNTEPDPAPEPVRPAVEGNGGFFVGVDGKVWFRRYDEKLTDEALLWGEFLEVWPQNAVKSTLCCYDDAAGVTEMFPDDGFGRLWFGVDGFYLGHRGSGAAMETYFKTLDGRDVPLGKGTVAGVSDNGRFAAVLTENNTLRVYRGTEELFTAVSDSQYQGFCALTDDGTLVYLGSDLGMDQPRLCSQGADGVEHVLGTLPGLPEESFAYGWEFEHCLVDGNDVWCSFGAYDGTGHFLSDVLCVRARLNAEGSVEAVEDPVVTEYPFVPKFCKDADGTVQRVENLPGELELTYEDGDLIRYGASGGIDLTVPAVMPDWYEGEELIVQTVENVGGAAYIIAARALRAEEDDIGWRLAYRLDTLRYLRVPLREGAQTEALDGLAWEPEFVPPFPAVYESFLGTWSLSATEVEGDRSDVLPEGTWEVLEFCEDGTAMITGSDYLNVFSHAEVLPTNGVSEGAAPYGLLFTGGTNDDMLWAYFEDGMLVATVMVHFEVDGASDSYSRTGFYERSVG